MIDFDVADGIATITMNRPDKMNALDTTDMEAFVDALHTVRQDRTIVVAIVTGAGDQAFTAGMDWKVLDEPDMPFTRFRDVPGGLMTEMPAYFKGIDVWKPVIAAINGHAIALGAHIVIGADLRIASSNATIAFNEVRFGDIGNGGAIARLPRQIPFVHAMDLLLTGRRIGAEEMLRMGLVNEVVPPEALAARARELAQSLVAQADPDALSITKRAVIGGLDMGLSQAMLAEALYTEMLHNRHGADESRMFTYSREFRT
jgi:E-phenylitaconyl-CoA hydratase